MDPVYLPVKITVNQARPFVYRIISRKNGLNLKSTALEVLAEFLGKNFGNEWRSEESEVFLDAVCKKWKDEGRGMFIEGEELQQVITNHLNEQNSSTNQAFDWTQYFKGVNAADTKRWVYNPSTHSFEFLPASKSMLGTADQGAKIADLHYHMVLDKLYRNEQFQPAGLAISSDSYSITSIKNMYGAPNGQEFFLFGLLEKQVDGPWNLIDNTAAVELEFSVCKYQPERYYPSGGFVLVHGVLVDGCITVHTMGSPIPESREESMEAFGQADFYGQNQTLDESLYQTLEVEKLKNENMRVCILGSDITLDNLYTFDALKRVFQELEQNPPLAVILPGSFVSHPLKPYGTSRDNRNQSQIFKEAMAALGGLIREFPQVCGMSKIILIPGPNDPWHAASLPVLPFNPLPEQFTYRVESSAPDVWIASNPARLLYLSHEMVIYRNNLGDLLRKHSLDTEVQTDTQAEDSQEDEPMEETPEADSNSDSEEQDAFRLSDRDREDISALTTELNTVPAPAKHISDDSEARKVFATVIDQCNLSPFSTRDVPVVWSRSHTLTMPQAPSSLVVIDPTTPPIKQTYNGVQAMNPGKFLIDNKAHYLEYWPSGNNYEFHEV